MTFSPDVKRFTYATHITSSVGWAGAVIVFIGLAAIGLTSPDEATTRGVYLVMAPAAWFALVPLAHASLLTGLALSLGTAWGIFRHYWVVAKLALTVLATGVLLTYMTTFGQMAGVAGDPGTDLATVRNPSPLVHGVLALGVLFASTWLAVYKPFGATPYGRHSNTVATTPLQTETGATLRWSPAWTAAIVVLVVITALVVTHLVGGVGRR